MDSKKIGKRVRTIEIKANSDRLFFLIHGYTGSTTDFNDLGIFLNQHFNANVKIICLKGHATKISDLDELFYEDFFNQVEKELKSELRKGRKVVLGGYSFGAYLALHLASKYPVKGVFNISIPFQLKHSLFFKFMGLINPFKKYWKKKITLEVLESRKGHTFYTHMHRNGLKIIFQARNNFSKYSSRVFSPCLTIHTKNDPLSKIKGIKKLERKINSTIKSSFILEDNNHNLFYSNEKDKMFKLIIDFFDGCFDKEYIRESVSAVVPAYNEEKRIREVLKVLVNTPSLKEIIVVDDGSKDNTEKIVKGFKRVKYLKNENNMGKSYSMDRGVKVAKSDIIFFCDADLKDFSPEIVESIILPVANREVDMFIGVRNNKMQKAYKKFAINSGERALRKEVWNKLPSFYKHRYRIEAGLNNFVKVFGRGYGYRVFPYYQTLKEKKYGLFKGTFLRWWMNFDVSIAVLRFHFFDRWNKKYKIK